MLEGMLLAAAEAPPVVVVGQVPLKDETRGEGQEEGEEESSLVGWLLPNRREGDEGEEESRGSLKGRKNTEDDEDTRGDPEDETGLAPSPPPTITALAWCGIPLSLG